ncbi:MAG: putative metal-dependent hydrolase [Planctomycetota bacterium]|nr:putative metal-dependent hydrolase [Planctomycetota bacterium]
MEFEPLRFPIGPFQRPLPIGPENVKDWIEVIARFPSLVELETQGLSVEQLNWPYRPGGWSIKQVVHHCADSHMNSIIRFKLALTEHRPTIRPYFEDRWAELADSQTDDISGSIATLHGVHARWKQLLSSLGPEELARSFNHPESDRKIPLDENIGLYAWHCEHHLAHVRQALESGGKYAG